MINFLFNTVFDPHLGNGCCLTLISASMQSPAENTKKSSLILSLVNLKFKVTNGGFSRASTVATPP